MRSLKLMGAALMMALAMTVSACGGGTGENTSASPKEHVLKLAFNQGVDHPEFQVAEKMSDELSQQTDGRYSIKSYPGESLGSQADVIKNLRDGTVDMMYVSGAVMESFNPDFVVYNLPYIFESKEAAQAIIRDEQLNKDLYTSVKDEGIVLLGAFYTGERNIYNSKRPIKTPEDLSGLKIRVQQSDSQVRALQLMGATASPLGLGDVYSALQTGILDGAENNGGVYHAMRHDEVAKYFSQTKHMACPDYLVISSKTWEEMSSEDQRILTSLVRNAQESSDEKIDLYSENQLKDAIARGAKVNDDVDIAAFKQKVKPLIDGAIEGREGRQKLYDAIQKANSEHPGTR